MPLLCSFGQVKPYQHRAGHSITSSWSGSQARHKCTLLHSHLDVAVVHCCFQHTAGQHPHPGCSSAHIALPSQARDTHCTFALPHLLPCAPVEYGIPVPGPAWVASRAAVKEDCDNQLLRATWSCSCSCCCGCFSCSESWWGLPVHCVAVLTLAAS